jgi:hypothetical protein
MTKEALKLALEKFEFMNHVDSIFEGEFDFQINAIKEALAQPEQDWIERERAVGYREGHQNALKQMAQPEQEPKCVAVVEVFGKDWRLDFMSLPVGKHKLYAQQYTHIASTKQELVGWKLVPIEPTNEMLKAMDECSTEGYDERLLAGHASSVYMAAVDVAPTPPQRKPLTDEEIETYRYMIDWTAHWSYINFARAIEAAHGIKGEA